MAFLNRIAWIALLSIALGAAHSMVVEVQTEAAGADATTEYDIPTPTGEAPEPSEESPAETTGDEAAESTDEVVNEQADEQASRPSEQPRTGGKVVLGFEITTEQALMLYDNGIADFVDARKPEHYEEGHIPFALNLSAEMMDAGDPRTEEVLPMLDPSRPIVIYCGGGDCTDSHAMAIRLEREGFTKLHIFTDGYPAWVADGREVETGGGL